MRQNLTPCRRDKPGNHIWREPLHRKWQTGLVCIRCGRRKRKRVELTYEN